MIPFTPFNRHKTCRYGEMLYNVHDLYVGRSLDLYGEYSQAEVELFRQWIEPGQVVLEVGANLGAHTVPLAQIVGNDGLVIAFEPQRLLFQTLCGNVALNSIPNVHCLLAAVSESAGSVRVPLLNYHMDLNFASLRLGDFDVGEPVSMVTLDSYRLTRCDFLKVDVEGMEQQVLAGATQMIATRRPILYLENDKPEKQADLIRQVHDLGYRMFWHFPPLYNPANFFGNPQNVFLGVQSNNMLCLPNESPRTVVGLKPVVVPPRENAP